MEASINSERQVTDDVRLNEVVAILWRRKWFLVFVTFLAIAGTFFVSYFTPPVFEASTTVLVDLASQSQMSEFSAITSSERGVRTYAELIQKRPVLEEAIARLHLTMSSGSLSNNVRAQLVDDTQILEVKVQDSNPVRAAALANTIVDVFEEQNEAFQAGRFASSKASLSSQLDELSSQILTIESAIDNLGSEDSDIRTVEFQRLQAELADYQVSYLSFLSKYEELQILEAQSFSNLIQVEPAKAPGSPIRPRTSFNILVAGVVGFSLAVGIVFFSEHLDDTLRTARDVTRASGLQVLG